MVFTAVYKIHGVLLEKLISLFQLFRERKTEYEAFAYKVDDRQLKQTVVSLSQETNQYATELSSQIQTMGGNLEPVKSGKAYSNPGNIMVTGLHDILKSCELSEQKMITAYRSILNEPFLNINLRKLIRYQLNGLMFAFLKLKLLNTTFHR